LGSNPKRHSSSAVAAAAAAVQYCRPCNRPALHSVAMRALVRGLARTFQESLKMAPASEQKTIDMAKAHEQQQAYVQLLRSLLPDVIEVPADHAHPGESCKNTARRSALLTNMAACNNSCLSSVSGCRGQQVGTHA
jgi:hypothetical protein